MTTAISQLHCFHHSGRVIKAAKSILSRARVLMQLLLLLLLLGEKIWRKIQRGKIDGSDGDSRHVVTLPLFTSKWHKAKTGITRFSLSGKIIFPCKKIILFFESGTASFPFLLAPPPSKKFQKPATPSPFFLVPRGRGNFTLCTLHAQNILRGEGRPWRHLREF